MLPGWDGGTFTATIYWTAQSGASGTVIAGCRGRCLLNDDSLDLTYGTGQTVTDTLLHAEDEHIAPATGAITAACSGSAAAGKRLFLQLYRAGGSMTAEMRVLGLLLTYTVTTLE
jgi:hypothetical protein